MFVAGSNKGSFMVETIPVAGGKLQPKPNNNFKKFMLTVTLGGLLIGGAIIYWHYFYAYQDGHEKGILLRFAQGGNIIPTYEGALDRRSMDSGYSDADTFFFSVTDKTVALELAKVIGKKILVHYDQYHGPLPWRGNNYNGQNEIDGQCIVDSLIKTTADTATGF